MATAKRAATPTSIWWSTIVRKLPLEDALRMARVAKMSSQDADGAEGDPIKVDARREARPHDQCNAPLPTKRSATTIGLRPSPRMIQLKRVTRSGIAEAMMAASEALTVRIPTKFRPR